MRSPSDPESPAGSGRRDFLRAVTTLTGLAVLPVSAQEKEEKVAVSAPDEAAPVVYLAFGPDEAALVERLVGVLCPADDLSPGGVECGLATFIDRQLAGAFGHGERLYLRGPWRPGQAEDGYQLPQTPEQYFKLGLAALDELSRQQYGHGFALVSDADAESLLQLIASGRVVHPQVRMEVWFNELVYPLFEQACFSDPVYGGNRDKVFWKMIGYPGLPAVNGLNMVRYRGKPFPGAGAPKSIQDFS
jgi:gluconate 2-dehydrogenase gamma chain